MHHARIFLLAPTVLAVLAVTASPVAATPVVSDTINVGDSPTGVAFTPDGTRAYVTNYDASSVSVINTATDEVTGYPVSVGDGPSAVAVTPDGTRAYVANGGSGFVSVIDTTTNTVSGSPIVVGSAPLAVAITPDGTRVYVTNFNGKSVSVIDTTTNQTLDNPISVGTGPSGVAITPDGKRAYVTNRNSDTVSIIDTTTNQIVGSDIPVGDGPEDVAVSPDGTRAYVTNSLSNSVSVLAIKPSPPRSTTASPGDSQLNVSWQAPSFTGGQPISQYVATASPGGSTCTTSGATACTITGLNNGTAHTVTVTAKNSIGTSEPSGPSPAVIPNVSEPPQASNTPSLAPPPGKVSGVKAKASKGSAKITWKATSGADSYRVRISKPGGKKYKAWKTTPNTKFKATVKKGKKYRFQITAVGTGGKGPTTTIKFKGK